MSLIPVLRLVSLAEDAASLVVQDATGNYNAGSNPGGYGAPNPASNTITSVLFQLASFKSLSTYSTKRVTSTAELLGAGLTLSPADFSSTGGAFEDGVYDVKYDVAFNLGAIDITPGAKSFILANADTVLAGCAGFILTNVNNAKIYYLDQTKALTNTGGFVTENFPAGAAVNQAASQKVFESNLKFLVAAAGNKCLNADIAIWSDLGCEGTDHRDLLHRYMMQLAMNTKFTQNLLYDAHNLAVKLASYCNTQSGGCGC